MVLTTLVVPLPVSGWAAGAKLVLPALQAGWGQHPVPWACGAPAKGPAVAIPCSAQILSVMAISFAMIGGGVTGVGPLDHAGGTSASCLAFAPLLVGHVGHVERVWPDGSVGVVCDDVPLLAVPGQGDGPPSLGIVFAVSSGNRPRTNPLDIC